MNHASDCPELAAKPSVLIVDPSEENREVLQTALMQRGVCTLTAKHAVEGADLVRRHHPDLVVLDLECQKVDPKDKNPPFWASGEYRNVPLIILGTLRRNSPSFSSGEFISKPYHYKPLIRRIEEMLGAMQQNDVRKS